MQTAVVSAGGTIQSTNITDPGSGYLTVPTVSFASTLPQIKEVGKTWVERTSYMILNIVELQETSLVFLLPLVLLQQLTRLQRELIGSQVEILLRLAH